MSNLGGMSPARLTGHVIVAWTNERKKRTRPWPSTTWSDGIVRYEGVPGRGMIVIRRRWAF
jgi:hypothetical protein